MSRFDTGGGDYRCECKPGYVDNTGYECADFDECTEGTHDCLLPAYCVNLPGTYRCDCPVGYDKVENSLGTTCVDINECAITHICGETGYCVNTVGSYECYCLPGFFWVAGYDECVSCPPGYYIEEDAEEDDCVLCPPNTFNNETDVYECEPCTPFSTAPAGGARVCECDPGFFYSYEKGICQANCSLGELRVIDYACIPCPLGTFGTKPSECEDCPSPTTTFETGQLECTCEEGYIVTEDNDCAKICGPGFYVEPVNELCLLCIAGTYSNNTSTDTTCTQCPIIGQSSPAGSDHVDDCVCQGVLKPNYETGRCDLYCDPGISRPVPYTECHQCGTGFYSDEVNQEECTACPKRTTSPQLSTDILNCSCAKNAYHPKGLVGVECRDCPTGATCKGGDAQPRAREGYYPAGDNNFVECSPYEACKRDGVCSEGYVGDRCAACEVGYHRVQGKCKSCGLLTTISLAVGVFMVTVFCGVLFTYNYSGEALIAFPALIIGLNSLQIAAEYGRLNAAWPPIVESIFEVLSLVSFSIELVAPECVVAGRNTLVLRFVLTMLMPVAVASLFGFCFLVFKIVGRTCYEFNSRVHHDVRRAILESGMQLLLVFYLPVSASVFGFFDCINSGVVNEKGQAVRVVRSSPDVVCGGETWMSALPYALISLIAYPLLAPTVFGFILIYSHWTLGDMFNNKFSYLTNRYRPRLYFFEIFILFRKIGVVATMTFVSGSAYIRAGAAMSWLLFNFICHVALRPYRLSKHNALESTCLLTVCVLLQEGVMLQDKTMGETGQDVVMVFTFILLFVVIGAGVCYDMWARNHLDDIEHVDSRTQHTKAHNWLGVMGTFDFDAFVGVGAHVPMGGRAGDNVRPVTNNEYIDNAYGDSSDGTSGSRHASFRAGGQAMLVSGRTIANPLHGSVTSDWESFNDFDSLNRAMASGAHENVLFGMESAVDELDMLPNPVLDNPADMLMSALQSTGSAGSFVSDRDDSGAGVSPVMTSVQHSSDDSSAVLSVLLRGGPIRSVVEDRRQLRRSGNMRIRCRTRLPRFPQQFLQLPDRRALTPTWPRFGMCRALWNSVQCSCIHYSNGDLGEVV